MTSICPSFDDHIVPDAFSSVTRTKRSRDSSFSSVFSEEELFSNCKRSKHEDEFSFSGPPSADSGIAFDLFSITDTTNSQLQSTDPFCNLEPFASSSMNSKAPHPGICGGMQLIIQEQPEEYYRARYESEGYRGPLKGQHECYPSVRVISSQEFKYGTVDVKLVHGDGSDHTSCSLDDTSEERKNALSKKIGPHNNMTAEFEDLRIRREKRKENSRKQVEKSASKEGHSDKVACLLFTATVQTDRGTIKLTAQSNPIQLTTAPEAAELHWIKPSRGHFTGHEEVVIKGSKMTSPKVIFYINVNGQQMELHGVVDKDKSHQNVLLVKTPPLPPNLMAQHCNIPARVVVTTGRAHMPSQPLPFEYIPNHICHECMQTVARSSSMTAAPLHTPPPAQPNRSPPPPSPTPVTNFSSVPQNVFNITQPNLPSLPPMSMPIKSQPTRTAQIPIPSFPPVSTPLDYTQLVSTMPPPTCIGGSITNIPSSPNLITYTSATQQQMSQDSTKDEDMLRYLIESDSESSMTYNKSPDEPSVTSFLSIGFGPTISQVTSPCLSPEVTSTTVNSPISDTPCYSPVTPVQSPLTAAAPWNHIEHIISSLQLPQAQIQNLMMQCNNKSPLLLQEYSNAGQDMERFRASLRAMMYPYSSYTSLL